MRETAGSAAAPAARCRTCLRWGSFILHLPLASHHSITSSAGARNLSGIFETEHHCGLDVDHQLELRRWHHRQITRLLAFEDASGVDAGLAVCIGIAGRVANQTACHDVARDTSREFYVEPLARQLAPVRTARTSQYLLLLFRSLLLFVAYVIHSKHATGTILNRFVSGGIGHPKNGHISVVCFALFYGL